MPFITQHLLPKWDNRGRPFGRKHYRAFHARLIRRFGGWTRKGQAEGAWLGPSGEIFTDEHWIYEVGHARRDLRFWQAEKERLKVEFDMSCVFCSVCLLAPPVWESPLATIAFTLSSALMVESWR